MEGSREGLQKTHVGCALRHKYEGVTVITKVKLAKSSRQGRQRAAEPEPFDSIARATPINPNLEITRLQRTVRASRLRDPIE